MSPADPRKTSHSLADHSMGALAAHEHGEGEYDHDHDSDFYLDANSKSLEAVELISIGIDVGSSSTQVAFSKLVMRGPGEHRALRGRAKDRETIHLSPIAPTPFRDDDTIGEPRLRAIIDRAFAAAGLTPNDIETGVVILTGAAAERRNAESIARFVAEDIGDLVCAAAGHHMEAMLAAHGSGAVAASREGGGRRLLLIDIGGATTKFALIDDGRVTATAAIPVGGRLLVIDKENRITRLESAGATFARRAGFDWRKGDAIDPRTRQSLAALMADDIVSAAGHGSSAVSDALFLTEPLASLPALDGVMISGGVGEYVHGRETRDFGDLGRALGLALRTRIDAGALGIPLLPAGECIRATVLGASEYSVQLSGETIFISSHAALLPARDLPALRPTIDVAGVIDPARIAEAIRAHRGAFDMKDATRDFALSLPWRGAPAYERLRALAEGVASGLDDIISAGRPIYLIVEGDIALTLGSILKNDLRIESEILAIDGVVSRDFDFVDIGRLRLPSHTVPVTIKSLLFGEARKSTRSIE